MKKYLLKGLVLAAVFTAVIFLASQFARSDFEYHGTKGVCELSIGAPRTVVIVAGGSVTAATHRFVPLHVIVKIEQYTISDVVERTLDGQVEEEKQGIQKAVLSGVKQAAYKWLVAALVFGLLLAPFCRVTLRFRVVCVLTPVLVVALLLLAVRFQFRMEAFERPRFQGSLMEVIPALRTLQSKLGNSLESRRKVLEAGRPYLETYYPKVLKLFPDSNGKGTKILVASDIHLDPTGWALLTVLAKSLKVHFILNLGDLTDYGTPAETRYSIREITQGGIPWVDASEGNHDAPPFMQMMRSVPSVTVLDSSMATVAGVRIFGIADARSRGETLPPTRVARRGLAALLRLTEREPTPTVVAIHNPTEAGIFAGKVSLVLSGHTHRPSLKVVDGTVFANPGSASGLSPLYARTDRTFSVILLRIHEGKPVEITFFKVGQHRVVIDTRFDEFSEGPSP